MSLLLKSRIKITGKSENGTGTGNLYASITHCVFITWFSPYIIVFARSCAFPQINPGQPHTLGIRCSQLLSFNITPLLLPNTAFLDQAKVSVTLL